MSESQVWDAVDAYFGSRLAPDDEALGPRSATAPPPGCRPSR